MARERRMKRRRWHMIVHRIQVRRRVEGILRIARGHVQRRDAVDPLLLYPSPIVAGPMLSVCVFSGQQGGGGGGATRVTWPSWKNQDQGQEKNESLSIRD